MSRKRLTQKQETFILEYFQTGNATQSAITAGYSKKTAFVIATENLKKPYLAARLDALRKKAQNTKIMDVVERKERLSEIARARLTDFTEAGKNGARIKIDLQSANSGALQEVTTEVLKIGGKDSESEVQVTKIKLLSSIQAIAELNKMSGDYEPAKVDLTSGGKPLVTFVIGQGYTSTALGTSKEITQGQ